MPLENYNSFYFYGKDLSNFSKLFIMPIIQIILVIVVVGVVLWLINRYIPMQQTVKTILNVVVVIILIVWLIRAFGLWDMKV